LAHFIAEFTSGPPPHNNPLERWILNVNGMLNSKGAGIGLVLTTPNACIIEQSYTLGFRATNNEAKYEAVIAGLKMVATLGVTILEVRCDSLLIVSQVNGEYTAKDDRMIVYSKVVAVWKVKFSRCDFKQVSRSENSHTEPIAMLASAVNFQFRCKIPIEHIPKPNIYKPDVEVFRPDRFPRWRVHIISYLKERTLPGDKAEA